jgi:hypothetical protein
VSRRQERRHEYGASMPTEAVDLSDPGTHHLYELVQAALATSLAQRPGEDLVAMCLRKPEAEATDALRGSLNRTGAAAGHLARREASLGVARTDLILQDLPSGQLLAAVEAKAVTAADALAPLFADWFDPQVAGDVSKLVRSPSGLRLFLVFKTHWRWMSRPEMYAYPRLLRNTPRTPDTQLSDDAIAQELIVTHAAVVDVLARHGVGHVRAHVLAAGAHPDVGSVVLTGHMGIL